MANKTQIEFDGFEEAISRLSELEGDVKKTTENALKETRKHVHENLNVAMQKHNRTFKTVRSLDNDSNVQWVGSVASISVGFDLTNGGLPSIFLMYGTPRMSKDQNLYNAVYGKKTKDEVMKIQRDIFYDEIRRLGG